MKKPNPCPVIPCEHCGIMLLLNRDGAWFHGTDTDHGAVIPQRLRGLNRRDAIEEVAKIKGENERPPNDTAVTRRVQVD